MVRRCKATNANGQPCSAQPVRASGLCVWHCPDSAAQLTEGRRRGGVARSNAQRARKKYAGAALSLRSVQGLLSTVLQDVIDGTTEPGIATAAATVGRAIASVAQVGDLETRLAELEERAAGAERGIA